MEQTNGPTYTVWQPGRKAVFRAWIACQGGVAVWRSENPGEGECFGPAETPDGCAMAPPAGPRRQAEVVHDLARFRFVDHLREVGRFKARLRPGPGGQMVLREACRKRLDAVLRSAGADAGYRFDQQTGEAIVVLPVWEE